MVASPTATLSPSPPGRGLRQTVEVRIVRQFRPSDSVMWEFYAWVREYLRAARAGNLRRSETCSGSTGASSSRLVGRIMRDESEDFTVRRTAYQALRDIWIPWRRRVEIAEYYRNKLYEMVEHDPNAWKQWVDWEFSRPRRAGKLAAGVTRSGYLGGPRRADSSRRPMRPARRRRK